MDSQGVVYDAHHSFFRMSNQSIDEIVHKYITAIEVRIINHMKAQILTMEDKMEKIYKDSYKGK